MKNDKKMAVAWHMTLRMALRQISLSPIDSITFMKSAAWLRSGQRWIVQQPRIVTQLAIV